MVSLYDYQKKCLDETSNNNCVAYYLDMGLGKTFVGSEKLIRLYEGRNQQRDLLVCQKSKIDDWREHFAEHYSNVISAYDLTDKKQWNDFFNNPVGFRHLVGIINYDLVWRRKEFLNLKEYTLMLDESSLIQNETAKRSKFILKLKKYFKNVILLSGTPTDGKYEKLWTQAVLLGWNIKKEIFLRQYVNFKTIEVDGFYKKIVDPDNPYKNVDRLKRKFREHGAVFMKTEEVIELPVQNFNVVKVEKIKEYNKFNKNSYVMIGDDELVGDNILSKRLRLRQLCGQYNKFKMQAFVDLVESTSDFNDELCKLKAITKELERPISEVNGNIKDLSAYENEENSITFIQYQAGAMGLNLQKANKIIYFTLPLKSEYFEQSKKRIHRVGQEKPCFYYQLICKDSIEEDIQQTLEMRRDYTDELFKSKYDK